MDKETKTELNYLRKYILLWCLEQLNLHRKFQQKYLKIL